MDTTKLSERTTVGVFFRQAERFAGAPLIHHAVGNEWQTVSWDGMRRAVLAIASALVEQDIKSGDHVVLLSENRLEWIYCDFAIQAAGAITVPVYAGTPPDMVEVIVANCEAVLAIAADEKLAAKLTTVPTVRIDVEVAEWTGRMPARLDEVVMRMKKLQPDDVCTIVYTSGTTGDPKGAVIAHRNVVDVTAAVLKAFPLSRDDFTLSWLPMSHVFERINGFFSVVMYGGQTWLSHGVDHLTEDLATVRPTVLLSVPRVYEKMHSAVMQRVRAAGALRQAMFAWAIRVGTDFSHATAPGPILKAQHRIADRLVLAALRNRLTGGRLRFFISGGAALARNIEEFFWAIGVPILNGWGMTETSSGACSNTLTDHRFLTVGKPFPGIELKIAADGEILVNSPGNMLGYHKNPTATAETLKDGWIYSGDIGEIDADGFLRITDRKKELIKTAVGKYVAPQRLEFELQKNDLVEQAVAIGEGRPYVTALIVPDWAVVNRDFPGRPEDLVDDPRLNELIQQHVDRVNQTLGNWESIKYFRLLAHPFTEESGEITPTLKIKRRVIATRYAEQIESMYAGRSKSS